MNRNEKDKLILCRNGSPLIVGLGENEIFVASESLAFEKYTLDCVALKEGEQIEINLSDESLSAAFKKRRETRLSINAEFKPKEGFSTFYEQEIYSQPNGIAMAMNNGARVSSGKGYAKLKGLEEQMDRLLEVKNLIIIGCGTSFYAGLVGEYFMRRYKCFSTVICLEASNFTEYDIPGEVSVLWN